MFCMAPRIVNLHSAGNRRGRAGDLVSSEASLSVHPVFPGKAVPVRKKAPPSRNSKAIATHAAPGVNGHGIHRIHPANFSPLHPPHLFGGGGGTQLPERGCGGPCFPCFPWLIQGGVEGSRIVPSITYPKIPGRTFFLAPPGETTKPHSVYSVAI